VERVDQVRRFWDADAATYDRDPGHYPVSPLELAVWWGTLERLLPAAPASVLDVGAGTGFLSLIAAELGHHVTAVDLSSGMLGRLRAKRSSRRAVQAGRRRDEADDLHGPQRNAILFARGSHLWVENPGFEVRSPGSPREDRGCRVTYACSA
jgi:SAM-dependent methyltransferase